MAHCVQVMWLQPIERKVRTPQPGHSWHRIAPLETHNRFVMFWILGSSVCVCLCVCAFVTYTYIYIYAHTYTYTYIPYTYIYIYIFMHVCMCVSLSSLSLSLSLSRSLGIFLRFLSHIHDTPLTARACGRPRLGSCPMSLFTSQGRRQCGIEF